jgi:hypothetical protein
LVNSLRGDVARIPPRSPDIYLALQGKESRKEIRVNPTRGIVHIVTMAAVSDSASTVPICIADLEKHAKTVLDKMTYEYYFHGAADELSRLDNIEGFNRYSLF